MHQRIMVAVALACGWPRLSIADEPTTVLEVTIKASILETETPAAPDVA